MSYDFDLGPWTRRISTKSDTAQHWFDRGLNWTFAFNHDEAVACFRRAAGEDPRCVMAWWGIAYATGPFYNRPWIRYSDAEVVDDVLPVCHDAVTTALSLADDATAAEQALIRSLARRYRNDRETDRGVLNAWHRDYADAMRDVHRAHEDDPDIAALYVEAAITCTPRQLWNLDTGEPNPNARTSEVMPVLERWDEQDRARWPRSSGHCPHVHPCLGNVAVSRACPQGRRHAARVCPGRRPPGAYAGTYLCAVRRLCPVRRAKRTRGPRRRQVSRVRRRPQLLHHGPVSQSPSVHVRRHVSRPIRQGHSCRRPHRRHGHARANLQ